eukprot:Skav214264  [mRNA]  locus=scaffold1877:74991:79319:+ [translate_table: standard]
MYDRNLDTKDGIRESLAYVLPQINSAPTVAGYSPSQWVLGYQPNFPGDLLGEGVNPTHLSSSASFEETMQRRTAAKIALIKADQDQKLRRALLRRYSGTNSPLQSGQLCWYWRDARAADLVKIRWRGPARVVLREDDEAGKPLVYWIAHGTQLIRCAPHHVRPDFHQMETTSVGGLEEARRSVMELKSRGVTRFLDLERINKRQLDDMLTEDEAMDDDDNDGQPPRQRPRLQLVPPAPVAEPTPVPEPPSPLMSPLSNPGSVTPVPITPADTPQMMSPSSMMSGNPLPVVDEVMDQPPQAFGPMPEVTPPGVPSLDDPPVTAHPTTPLEIDEPEPSGEPSVPPSTTSMRPTAHLDPATAALYEPANVDENFGAHRLRIDQQETMLFGPIRRGSRHTDTPYSARSPMSTKPPEGNPSSVEPSTESFSQVFNVEFVEATTLPEGWSVDADGCFHLEDKMKDFWEVRAGCLIRHHVNHRHSTVIAKDFKDIPLDPKYLDPVRVTVVRHPDGRVETLRDAGSDKTSFRQSWIGATIFQINGLARKELCMYAGATAAKIGRDTRRKINVQTKKQGKKVVNERELTADQRALFQAAKCKELKSFFENDVWIFDTASNADPSRTLTSRILLSWSRNPDGTPRAKARLIVRGYSDVDALQGTLETSSPTTTRLSRNVVLSMASVMQWDPWTADVSTAFLQGLPQERALWVKLPADALRLLGADPDCRMLLRKPCYGQLDAPRRWFLEACRRLRELGLRQHALDPCCFLIYSHDFVDKFGPDTESQHSLGDHGLCGMIILHVDDMLGCGDSTSAVYVKVIDELKKTFTFCEWKDGSSLEYCGATIVKESEGIKVHHHDYLKKIKPMTLPKHVGPDHELSQREVTELRGLLGSLQWPAVQSSPHLQASTSTLTGTVTKGLAQTVFETNKLLKFAKENLDVGLSFPRLGPLQDLRMITAFDASFCSRPDGSSQGGYFILLAPKRVLETEEDFYHILDWRSFKLPRVARSSLAAEAQAAGVASDATEFTCRYYEHLLHPDLPLASLLKLPSSLDPVMITDAKVVFDSYHREALVSNVTDRRSSLEVRVVKEQMQSVNGTLRWVSSDRQLADGLTKSSMRQNLADRLRHGKIKFLYDPDYIAAKKKPLSERQKELKASSRSRSSKPAVPTIIDEDVTIVDETFVPHSLEPEHEAPEHEVFQYDMAPADDDMNQNDMTSAEHEVPAEVQFAQSEHTVRYVNVSGINVDDAIPVLYAGTALWMLEFLPTAQAMDVDDLLPWFESLQVFPFMKNVMVMMAILACVAVAWCFGKRQQYAFHVAQIQNLAVEGGERVQLAENKANSLAIALQRVEIQLEEKHAALMRATTAYTEAREAARQYADALRLAAGEMGPALRAETILDQHSLVCAMGQPVSLQDGSNVWHANADCDQLYDSGREIRLLQPCPRCSTVWSLRDET